MRKPAPVSSRLPLRTRPSRTGRATDTRRLPIHCQLRATTPASGTPPCCERAEGWSGRRSQLGTAVFRPPRGDSWTCAMRRSGARGTSCRGRSLLRTSERRAGGAPVLERIAPVIEFAARRSSELGTGERLLPHQSDREHWPLRKLPQVATSCAELAISTTFPAGRSPTASLAASAVGPAQTAAPNRSLQW